MFGSRRAPASAPGAEEEEGGAAPLLKSRDPHLAGNNNIPSLCIGQFHPQPAPILCCLCFQLLLLPLKVPQPFRQLRSRGHRRLGVGLQKILLVAKLLGPGKSWVFDGFWHIFGPEKCWKGFDHDLSPWFMTIVWEVMTTTSTALWNWRWSRISNNDTRRSIVTTGPWKLKPESPSKLSSSRAFSSSSRPHCRAKPLLAALATA